MTTTESLAASTANIGHALDHLVVRPTAIVFPTVALAHLLQDGSEMTGTLTARHAGRSTRMTVTEGPPHVETHTMIGTGAIVMTGTDETVMILVVIAVTKGAPVGIPFRLAQATTLGPAATQPQVRALPGLPTTLPSVRPNWPP